MKQIWISKAGEPETLTVQDGPTPTPRSGEVRIQVEASGVNFADILGRMGIYPDAPKIPYVPGYEVAGVVDAVGQGVADLKEGDAVFAATQFSGYSDLLCVPARQTFKRLEWMSAEHGAALPVNYLTAYMSLMAMGSIRPGSRVLIHGAAGGVGLAALDICRIVGAETWGTASASKHPFLLERGLNHPIDYHHYDYRKAVRETTNGQGVDIILDPFGGRHWPQNYNLLRPGGRLICLGMSAAAPGKRRSWRQMLQFFLHLPFYTPIRLMRDNKGVMGVNLGRLWDESEMLRSWMAQIVHWYDEALFRPQIDRTFKFSQAAEAHHYIQDRKNVGKVLLIPDDVAATPTPGPTPSG
jgi:NADPH:quinone reductase-like Zn-dependent oxidoreductase